MAVTEVTVGVFMVLVCTSESLNASNPTFELFPATWEIRSNFTTCNSSAPLYQLCTRCAWDCWYNQGITITARWQCHKHCDQENQRISFHFFKYAIIYWGDGDTNLPKCVCVDETFVTGFSVTHKSNCNMKCPNDGKLCGGLPTNSEKYATILLIENCIYRESQTVLPTILHTATILPTSRPNVTVLSTSMPTATILPTSRPTVTVLPTSMPTVTASETKVPSQATKPNPPASAATDKQRTRSSTSGPTGTTVARKEPTSKNAYISILETTLVGMMPNIAALKYRVDMRSLLNSFKTIFEACRQSVKENVTTICSGENLRNITPFLRVSVELAYKFAEGNRASFQQFFEVVNEGVQLLMYILTSHQLWNGLSIQGKGMISTEMLKCTEEILFQLMRSNENKEKTYNFHINSTEPTNLLVTAELINTNNTNNYVFPQGNRKGDGSKITLPAGWSSAIQSGEMIIVGICLDAEYITALMSGQYSSLSDKYAIRRLGGKVTLMNGKLLSLSILYPPNAIAYKHEWNYDPLTYATSIRGVQIRIQHDLEAFGENPESLPRRLHAEEMPKAVVGSARCVFWDTVAYKWSSVGCKKIFANRHHTLCECSHLTAFSVLMDVHEYTGKDYYLELLTLCLCSISGVLLLLTVILLSKHFYKPTREQQQTRATLTQHLSICLFVGNLLLMFVLDRNYFYMTEVKMCTLAAITTHYFFLAAFCWMLVEGIQVYIMVVNVFQSDSNHMTKFKQFAYCGPFVLIACNILVGYMLDDNPYAEEYYCWLEGSYKWSFIVPVGVVTAINTVCLAIAVHQSIKATRKTPKSSEEQKASEKLSVLLHRLKGICSLSVILGLTWIVGFFTIMGSPGGILASYIFTILNSSQGIFIYIFNCHMNPEVVSSVKRRMRGCLGSRGSKRNALTRNVQNYQVTKSLLPAAGKNNVETPKGEEKTPTDDVANRTNPSRQVQSTRIRCGTIPGLKETSI